MDRTFPQGLKEEGGSLVLAGIGYRPGALPADAVAALRRCDLRIGWNLPGDLSRALRPRLGRLRAVGSDAAGWAAVRRALKDGKRVGVLFAGNAFHASPAPGLCRAARQAGINTKSFPGEGAFDACLEALAPILEGDRAEAFFGEISLLWSHGKRLPDSARSSWMIFGIDRAGPEDVRRWERGLRRRWPPSQPIYGVAAGDPPRVYRSTVAEGLKPFREQKRALTVFLPKRFGGGAR